MVPIHSIRRLALAATAVTGVLAGLVLATSARAETISVVLPSNGVDAGVRQALKAFTAETGIDVDFQSMPWDDIRPKVVTAMAAGTAPADVCELDWSWVGQFGAAGWYTPLDGVLDDATLKDIPTAATFQYDGKLYGVPYANDFRVNSVNMAYLRKAGITGLPRTPEDILADARTLKAKGVLAYPVSIPLAAAEGTSTAWYFLTRMYGGELFDKDFNPLFTKAGSPGYKALQWIVQGLHDGVINPAMTGQTDLQVTNAFAAGDAAIDLAGHPYDMGTYDDAGKSKVAGQVVFALAGADPAHLASIGLPEALGVPVNTQHKDAALKFVKWWAAHEVDLYGPTNILPTRSAALQTLAGSGKLAGGADIAKYSPYTQAIFSQGTPPWYSEFSSGVAATINQLAKGQIGVDAAVAQIADRAKQAQQ